MRCTWNEYTLRHHLTWVSHWRFSLFQVISLVRRILYHHLTSCHRWRSYTSPAVPISSEPDVTILHPPREMTYRSHPPLGTEPTMKRVGRWKKNQINRKKDALTPRAQPKTHRCAIHTPYKRYLCIHSRRPNRKCRMRAAPVSSKVFDIECERLCPPIPRDRS